MHIAKTVLLLWPGLTISATLLAQQSAASARDTLLATNAARFAAMVRGDLAGLDTLLGPELIYTHTDGVLESKPEFLATLRTGCLRYQLITPDKLKARVYGEAGVVTGRSRMEVSVPAGGEQMGLGGLASHPFTGP